jgi:hypothetical protein
MAHWIYKSQVKKYPNQNISICIASIIDTGEH